MKKLFLLIAICCIFTAEVVHSQTIWTGETITFTKADYADWSSEFNQDRISESVWITRKNNQGLFNAYAESNYVSNYSPKDTEWAFGTTENLVNLNFSSWEETNESNPPGMINQDMVLYLVNEDIYVDIKFTSWTGGNSGGGFSYERASDPINNNNVNNDNIIQILPNPCREMIQVTGLTKTSNYQIYNSYGSIIDAGTISNNDQLDIQNLKSGSYFIRFQSGEFAKFIVQ